MELASHVHFRPHSRLRATYCGVQATQFPEPFGTRVGEKLETSLNKGL